MKGKEINMLCITMKRGEYFTVDGETVILFDQLSGERAHLTIHAPRNVAIVRGAVLERNGNPPPPCLAKLPARKKGSYRPEAIYRWNDQRERAVGRLEQVAQRLEENGSAEEAKFLRDQLSQIVPALWEDDLSIP